MLLYYPMQCPGQERSYRSLTKIISLPFGVIESIYQTNCMFITMISANVSVLVVGSIPTGIAHSVQNYPCHGPIDRNIAYHHVILLIMIFNTHSSYLIFWHLINWILICSIHYVIGRKLSTGVIVYITLHCNRLHDYVYSCYGYHDCTNAVVQIWNK